MRIELSRTPNWLKITWGYYDTAIEAEIVKRLGTVGALGQGRRYFVHASEVYRCMDIFPNASFAYEALCVADALLEPRSEAQRTPASVGVDESLQTLFKGIQNARKRDEEKRQYGKRRRGKKVEL